MTDDEERLHAYIPAEYDRRLSQACESKKEQVVEALELYFGDAKTSRQAIERQLSRMREKRAKGEQLVQTGEDMMHNAQENIDRLEEKLAQIEESVHSYDDALDEITAEMHNAQTSRFPEHAQIQEIAQTHDETPDDVISDLKERSDLPAQYFTPGPVQDNDSGLSLGGEGE